MRLLRFLLLFGSSLGQLVVGNDAIVIQQYTQLPANHRCFPENNIGFFFEYDKARVTDLQMQVQDPVNPIDLSTYLTTMEIPKGTCITIRPDLQIQDMMTLYKNQFIRVTAYDNRHGSQIYSENLIFDLPHFHSSGLHPKLMYLWENAGAGTHVGTLNSANGNAIKVLKILKYETSPDIGVRPVELRENGEIYVSLADWIDAENLTEIVLEIEFESSENNLKQSDRVAILIKDINEFIPSLGYYYPPLVSLPNNCSSLSHGTQSSSLELETCIFENLRTSDGIIYAIISATDLDSTSPNNKVSFKIKRNAVYNGKQLFGLVQNEITKEWSLRYYDYFDYCMVEPKSVVIQACDGAKKSLCSINTVPVYPPKHAPNALCVTANPDIPYNAYITNAQLGEMNCDRPATKIDVVVQNQKDFTVNMCDGDGNDVPLYRQEGTDEYYVCPQGCGIQTYHVTSKTDNFEATRIVEKDEGVCTICPLWARIILIILYVIFIIFWLLLIIMGCTQSKSTIDDNWHRTLYFCCCCRIVVPIALLYLIIFMFVFFVVLLILAIIFYVIYRGSLFCPLLLLLFWILFGLVLLSGLFFGLHYWLANWFRSYHGRYEQVDGKNNTTIINQTNCTGHDTVYIKEKRARPEGDLGSILKSYKEEADNEEYAYNMELASPFYADLHVSRPELFQTPKLDNRKILVNYTENNNTKTYITEGNTRKISIDEIDGKLLTGHCASEHTKIGTVKQSKHSSGCMICQKEASDNASQMLLSSRASECSKTSSAHAACRQCTHRDASYGGNVVVGRRGSEGSKASLSHATRYSSHGGAESAHVQIKESESHSANTVRSTTVKSVAIRTESDNKALSTRSGYESIKSSASAKSTVATGSSKNTNNKDLEIVFMIEGSDSFSENASADGKAFHHTIKWANELISKLYHSCDLSSFYVSMVQFSGLKQSRQAYIPGSNGIDHETKHFHYQRFFGPSNISDDTRPKPFETSISSELEETEPLSGCDYMYLCLQDLSLDSYFSDPKRVRKTYKILVLVGDGDWDCIKLKDASGSGNITQDEVIERASRTYDRIFAVIAPSHNFEPKKEKGKQMRALVETKISKPPRDGFYLITKRSKYREALKIHGEDIFHKIKKVF